MVSSGRPLSIDKRTVVITLKVLEPIRHVATRSLRTSGLAALDATEIELCSISVSEIDAFGAVNYLALIACLFHLFSSFRCDLTKCLVRRLTIQENFGNGTT